MTDDEADQQEADAERAELHIAGLGHARDADAPLAYADTWLRHLRSVLRNPTRKANP